MKLTKIITWALVPVILFMSYFLYASIKDRIDQIETIKNVEAKVIEKLKIIREAEIAYLSVNGNYTSNWDSLAKFIESGKFYILDKKEQSELTSYGAENIKVVIDTVGVISVKDSLFPATKYPNLDVANLSTVPGSGKKFNIYADEIEKNGIKIDVLEVSDPAPVNPDRKESNEALNKKPLRIGSREDVTTGGNWE